METIVVGVDGSEGSLAALRWAVGEARLRGARIEAVHAWSAAHVSTASEAQHLIDVDFAPLREDAAETLGAAVDTALDGTDDGVAVDRVVVEGPAAEVLVDAAASASLLVVGSRGLGGVRSLVLGSVGHECARRSPCPTVVVRSG